MKRRDDVLKRMLKTPWRPHKSDASVEPKAREPGKVLDQPRLGFVKEHGSKRRPVAKPTE